MTVIVLMGLMAVLACFRITQMLVFDFGPFEIFLRHRQFWGRRAAEGGSSKTVADAVNCPHCTGIWIAIPLGLMVVFPTIVGNIFIIIFAIAGGQSILESFTNK